MRSAGTSKEFVKEYISQATLRRVAAYTFTGSAGQQRVPAAFLENLPFPEIPESRQNEIVAEINRRQKARRLRTTAESNWQAAKQKFEAALLGNNKS